MKLDNKHIGKFRWAIYPICAIIGALLASTLGGFDLARSQAKHETALKVAYHNYLEEANRIYCQPKISDLKHIVKIKQAINEDTTGYESSIKELSTKQGCIKAIEIVFRPSENL